MNIQVAFLLYTILNMLNSQLSCFIPSISLKPFPYLAHSICHSSLLAAPTLHSTALSCFPHSLPSFAIFYSFLLFFKVFFLFFSLSYLIYFHLSSAAFFSSLYPSIFPSEPSLFLSLPAVWKQYLRHSAPSILSSKWNVWPCYIWFFPTGGES